MSLLRQTIALLLWPLEELLKYIVIIVAMPFMAIHTIREYLRK
jgi:hypothetical protein